MKKIKQLYYQLKQKLRTKVVKLLRRRILLEHMFKPTDLIKSRNGDSLFEVEELYYDRDLEPVHIVKKYGSTSGQVYSISFPAILDFVEFKGKAPGSNTMEI